MGRKLEPIEFNQITQTWYDDVKSSLCETLLERPGRGDLYAKMFKGARSGVERRTMSDERPISRECS